MLYFCIALMKGAFSSAGLEHLPYKQRVGGSNPSTPTTFKKDNPSRAFSSAGLEHLPYKQRVGGSNPSTPTSIRLIFRFFEDLAAARQLFSFLPIKPQ